MNSDNVKSVLYFFANTCQYVNIRYKINLYFTFFKNLFLHFGYLFYIQACYLNIEKSFFSQ